MTDSNSQVIDIWGYLKKMWRLRVIWLITFVLVMGAGASYAMTRPTQYLVTQTMLVTLPSAETEAQATQQGAALTGTVASYVKMATMPAVTDTVLAKHPEVHGLEALRGLLTVKPVGPLAIDISASGPDAAPLVSLLGDLGQSFATNAPKSLGKTPEALRFQLVVAGDPVVTGASSGRLLLLVASGVLALVVAMGAVMIADRVRPAKPASS